ncbi:uncharacterized protein LOC111057787 [Nilaparvata lugens]|uniref:uncharacterized protein LOC111057787 n=1 Tax=Nilaparvata lugens TaxID=108931 RepID=UPI00193DED79|nr:uncharacterized protein LOC111057787 [Nilaparvata lugens]
MGLLYNWSHLEIRILRLRDLQHFFTLLFFHAIASSISSHCDLMQAHFSRQHEIGELAKLNRKFSLEHRMDLKKYVRYAGAILLIRNTATSYLPMAYSVFLVLRTVVFSHSPTQHLPVITYFHYPKGYETWQVQLALNAFATYFYVMNTIFGSVIVMSNYFLGHISWYQLSLCVRYVRQLDAIESWEQARLHRLMNCVIKYHQHIMIHHSKFIRLSRVSILAYTFSCTFQLCTYIYSIIEMRKVKFIIQMVFTLILLYAFSSYGQKIVDEGERVRECLYDCEWVGRPLWFQKNLLIIMSRTLSSTEINCYGLLAINRLRFSKTLQAAYTYFNFLKGTVIQ